MHEMAVAADLLEIALEEANRLGAQRVNAVWVHIGAMRMVDSELIQDAWDALIPETKCANARLIIIHCPIVIECRVCKSRHDVNDWPGCCSVCGSDAAEWIGGDELELSKMDIELPTSANEKNPNLMAWSC